MNGWKSAARSHNWCDCKCEQLPHKAAAWHKIHYHVNEFTLSISQFFLCWAVHCALCIVPKREMASAVKMHVSQLGTWQMLPPPHLLRIEGQFLWGQNVKALSSIFWNVGRCDVWMHHKSLWLQRPALQWIISEDNTTFSTMSQSS